MISEATDKATSISTKVTPVFGRIMGRGVNFWDQYRRYTLWNICIRSEVAVMKVNKKHFSLILASFIALSFNSHFAQAARKTKEILRPTKVFAFKKVGRKYVRLLEVEPQAVVIKKTGIQFDRKNMYIGGYVVNTSNQLIPHVRISPSFVSHPRNSSQLKINLEKDLLNLQPQETRRFVIVRPIEEVKALLEHNVPLAQNFVFNCEAL